MVDNLCGMTRLRADFNGLFGDVLCLSHTDTCLDEEGNPVVLITGMKVVAFEPDSDALGNPDELLAAGTVEPAPPEVACRGSKWILVVDENGVRHQSELTP